MKNQTLVTKERDSLVLKLEQLKQEIEVSEDDEVINEISYRIDAIEAEINKIDETQTLTLKQ